MKIEVANELLNIRNKTPEELKELGFKTWMLSLFAPKTLQELERVAEGKDSHIIGIFHNNHFGSTRGNNVDPERVFSHIRRYVISAPAAGVRRI